MDIQTLQTTLESIAGDFAKQTRERQQRQQLDPVDFERLKEAGFLLTGVPEASGGLWKNPFQAASEYPGLLRTLAHGDPNVALVAAMHPAVLAYFLTGDETAQEDEAWLAQMTDVVELARSNWWGTMTSEPGSGGDIMRTKTQAIKVSGDDYQLTGDKHFGSGSGHASFMITTALPEGSTTPELFFIDMRDRAWDSSEGLTLTIPWEGIGMQATQSHAFRLENCHATKARNSDLLAQVGPWTSLLSNMMFTGVAMGVFDNAMAFAQQKVGSKLESLSPLEQTEWVRCCNSYWLAEQAFKGACNDSRNKDPAARLSALRCKVTIAELAEQTLLNLSKVVGGASFSKAMPLAQWSQDIRALAFLRPPLPLAFKQLIAMS